MNYVANYYAPRDLQLLSQNDEAFRAIESSRWPMGRYCPRCRSLYTKSVNTSVFRELYRCIDCGYMFNTFSGTIFQGTKLASIKFFQLFVIYDAAQGNISPREVSYALSVSPKTAVSLLSRMADLKAPERFTANEPGLSVALKSTRSRGSGSAHDDSKLAKENDIFFQYCDMKGIVINLDLFKRYLSYVLSPDISRYTSEEEGKERRAE